MALHTARPSALSHSICHNSTRLLWYRLRTLQNTGNYQGVFAKDQILWFLSCGITAIPNRKLWASIHTKLPTTCLCLNTVPVEPYQVCDTVGLDGPQEVSKFHLSSDCQVS